MLLKWQYATDCFTDSIQSLSKSQLTCHRDKQTDTKVHTGIQMTQNIQNNFKKEEQCWKVVISQFQNLLW